MTARRVGAARRPIRGDARDATERRRGADEGSVGDGAHVVLYGHQTLPAELQQTGERGQARGGGGLASRRAYHTLQDMWWQPPFFSTGSLQPGHGFVCTCRQRPTPSSSARFVHGVVCIAALQPVQISCVQAGHFTLKQAAGAGSAVLRTTCHAEARRSGSTMKEQGQPARGQ